MSYLDDFLIFIRKQASSAIFGGCLLFFLVLTKYVSVPGIYRYDLLFLIAIALQIGFVLTKIEREREVLVIFIFHVCAMMMEIFKTSPAVASWSYPEPAFFAIAGVPLFTGFMYSAVGSYIARAWRVVNFKFENFPRKSVLFLTGIAIYVNFFTNYFTYDIRYILFALLIVLFWKSKLHATLTSKTFTIHPLFSNALLALFVWLAEQIGTFARTWVYPDQVEAWRPVSFHMYTSWYMLLIFSFIIIYLLYKDESKPVLE